MFVCLIGAITMKNCQSVVRCGCTHRSIGVSPARLTLKTTRLYKPLPSESLRWLRVYPDSPSKKTPQNLQHTQAGISAGGLLTAPSTSVTQNPGGCLNHLVQIHWQPSGERRKSSSPASRAPSPPSLGPKYKLFCYTQSRCSC